MAENRVFAVMLDVMSENPLVRTSPEPGESLDAAVVRALGREPVRMQMPGHYGDRSNTYRYLALEVVRGEGMETYVRTMMHNGGFADAHYGGRNRATVLDIGAKDLHVHPTYEPLVYVGTAFADIRSQLSRDGLPTRDGTIARNEPNLVIAVFHGDLILPARRFALDAGFLPVGSRAQ